MNGKKVDIRSFQVQPGMIVSIKEKSRNHKQIVNALDSSNATVPDYLSLDREKFSGQMLSSPPQSKCHGRLKSISMKFVTFSPTHTSILEC